MTEVNIFFALTNIYGQEMMEIPEFWKKLAKVLLNNTYQLADIFGWINVFVDHKLIFLTMGVELPVHEW